MDDLSGITIHWDIEDVKSIAPTLTDQEAQAVLDRVKANHDATIGVNWDVISQAVDDNNN